MGYNMVSYVNASKTFFRPKYRLHPQLYHDIGSAFHLTSDGRFINLYGGDAVFATEDASIEDPLPAEDGSWSENVSPPSPFYENAIPILINSLIMLR